MGDSGTTGDGHEVDSNEHNPVPSRSSVARSYLQ